MRKNIPALFLFFFSLTAADISGQIFDYRYHESPAVSWNGINMSDSRQLSMGGISLFASGHSMQTANPALFSDIKGVEIGFTLNYIFYQDIQFY